MPSFRSILTSIVGDIEQKSSERYFMTVTCFSISVFLVFMCLFHLIINLKFSLVIIAGSSSVLVMGLYFLVRYTKYLYFPKVALTLLGLLMLDLTWYSKFLSNGPELFFVMCIGALIIWLWDGKTLNILLTIYFLNVVLLFLIDYNSPEYMFIYPSYKLRSIDIFFSFLFYSSIMIFLLWIIKKDFIRQKEKAIRSDKLKSAFLSNMSHEIRTPMNSIIGFSELLENETDYVKRHQYITIIKNSGNNLLKLISDIIDLSKIEAGDVILNFSDFSIREVFTEIKEIYTLELIRLQKSDINLYLYVPDGDIIINSDLDRIKQILFNLLDNAVKFTSTGSIVLGCEKKGGKLQFSVSDTGTGIPEEDQIKIFDNFSKFNYGTSNNEGTGIGLAIVKNMVEMLEGKVWLKSATGSGSTFFFSLPSAGPIISGRTRP